MITVSFLSLSKLQLCMAAPIVPIAAVFGRPIVPAAAVYGCLFVNVEAKLGCPQPT